MHICAERAYLRIVNSGVRILGGEHLLIVAVERNSEAVSLMLLRLEVEYSDKLVACLVEAAEHDHAVLVVVADDPLEARPVVIHFPQLAVVEIELVERLFVFPQALMLGEVENVPVKTGLVVPLLELRELLTHEHQLLAGVCHHIGEESSERSESQFSRTAHLVDHGAFSVNHFVVGYRQNVVLRESVVERECHKVMVIVSPFGVHGHISEHIVHPAHVPLEVESETSDICGLCDHRPCGGFLRDH